MIGNTFSFDATNQNIKNDQLEEINKLNRLDFTITLKYLSDELRNVTFPQEYFKKTVKEFKELLFPVEISGHKTIKMIYKGYMMQDSDLLSKYSLIENDVIHVLIINYEIDQNEFSPPPNIEIPNNNNVSINLNSNDLYVQIIRQGFDKYLEESFLEEDIECLREIYHVGYQIDKYSASRIQMFEKEETFLRTTPSVVRTNLLKIREERLKKEKGTYIHFIIGAILGYFFNVLIILIMVFFKTSKQAMVGTLLGFLLRIALISFDNVQINRPTI